MINKQKCKNASRYKAKFEPKCGCRVCWNKWNARPKVDKNVEAMRKASGNVTSDDLMVGLFYILLRDVVSPGKIEAILLELSNAHDYETTKNPKKDMKYLGYTIKDKFAGRYLRSNGRWSKYQPSEWWTLKECRKWRTEYLKDRPWDNGYIQIVGWYQEEHTVE